MKSNRTWIHCTLWKVLHTKILHYYKFEREIHLLLRKALLAELQSSQQIFPPCFPNKMFTGLKTEWNLSCFHLQTSPLDGSARNGIEFAKNIIFSVLYDVWGKYYSASKSEADILVFVILLVGTYLLLPSKLIMYARILFVSINLNLN